MLRREWIGEVVYAEEVDKIVCVLRDEIINLLTHLKKDLEEQGRLVRGPIEEGGREHKWILYVDEGAEGRCWQIVLCLRTSQAREGTLKGVDLALTFSHTGELIGELIPSREDKACPGKLSPRLEDDWTLDQDVLRRRLATIARLTGVNIRKTKEED